ncbi:MAG: outer membrane lipoprotein chaperone LolA [Casimicrobiaceae bacterium]
MRSVPTVLAVVLLHIGAAGVAQASGLGQLKAFLDGTKTAQGTFRQAVVSKTRPQAQASGGTFAFARPGKFRWMYEKPFEQLIVGDGARVWVYDRDLNQVIVRKLDVALGATPAALLAGDNALEKNFTLTEGAPAGDLEYIDAVPKAQESQFTKVRMGFRDNEPRVMELVDAFGQVTTLTFVTFERNPQLAATLFRFDVPAGADVVGDAR